MTRVPPQSVSDADTLGGRFGELCDRFGERPAIKTGALTLNYAALCRAAAATAAAAGAPHRVGVWVRSPLTYAVAFYAAILTGRPAVLLAQDIPADTVRELCRRFGVDLLISDMEAGPLGTITHLSPVMNPQGAAGFDRRGPWREARPDDVAVVLLTSGTTGSHKAVPVTHRNVIWTTRTFNRYLGLSDAHRELVLVPLTHSFGMRRLTAELFVGGCVNVLEGAFRPDAAMDCLEREACDVLAAVPAHIRFLMHFAKDFATAGAGLRYLELSSAPMSAAEKRALVELLPQAEVVMGYGLTEATRSALLRLNRRPDRLDTVGRPFPSVEIRICDENGQSLPPEEEGEITVTGPNVAAGYLEGGGFDRTRFEGGFSTGDVGKIDRDGYLRVLGRTDDIMNVGGRKLHPSELESRLSARFPNVDCAIGRVSHPLMGAQPVLCVAGEADTEAMLSDLRESFEAYKIPVRVVELAEIPRTANGKVLRGMLQQWVELGSQAPQRSQP